MALPIHARFTRPGKLPPAAALPGRVAVLDLAFDGADPERDLRWAAALGPRLAVWIDHHDQPCWERVASDPRFVLVPRALAPACPPLVTRERVRRFGPVDAVLAHGDLDGVLSAAKWTLLQLELPVPHWLDPDGIAADTRRGSLTPRGQRLDHALRGGGDRDGVRRAVVASVLAEARGAQEPEEVARRLDSAARAHARARGAAERAAAAAIPLADIPENAAVVDLRRFPSDQRVDVTAMMLALQQRYDWVIVLGRQSGGGLKILVSTYPERTGLDLRREFNLQGFAPFRVHVAAEALLRRLPSADLQHVLGTVG
ncbi:MAG: hypothetical protein EYC70_09435 [Planctomycetota bacterium]|nr:MAG: hypothetical protein EYC70_09435 [Planctomycetota bacterium]